MRPSPGRMTRVKQSTIKDVATRAGVSAGTVSNVLNRPSYVSEEIRLRVRDAIAELGYSPRDSARQFRTGRISNIGLVLADMGNPFFMELALGAEVEAKEAGAGLVICHSGEDVERETQNLDLLVQQRVQGIIVALVDETNERLAELSKKEVPLVFIDRVPRLSAHCWVSTDDVLGGTLVATHLSLRGHRRVAFAGQPAQNAKVADRFRGFADRFLKETGHTAATIEVEGWTVETGRRAGLAYRLQPAESRPTAIFCSNDLVALGLLQELTLAGMRVPDDVAIVGYDDLAGAEAAAVPLTTVRQPRRAVGRAAVRMLLDEIRSSEGHTHEHVQFLPELVVRVSA